MKIEGVEIIPKGFLLLNNWRVDSIINFPRNYNYPSAFRLRALQFLRDISFGFEDSLWFPGNMENVTRADSKLRLFFLLVTSSNFGSSR